LTKCLAQEAGIEHCGCLLTSYLSVPAGGLQAWRALRSGRELFPRSALEAAIRGSASFGAEAFPDKVGRLCSGHMRISVLQLAPDASRLLDWGAATDRLQLASALQELRPLVDVRLTTSTALFDPGSEWTTSTEEGTSGADLAALGHILRKEAAPIVEGSVALVFSPLLEQSRSLKLPEISFLKLTDSMLLVVDAGNGEHDRKEAITASIISWAVRGHGLFNPGTSSSMDGKIAAAMELAVQTCVADAGLAVERYLKVFAAAKSASVTSNLASEAKLVAEAITAAKTARGTLEDRFQASTRAWTLAHRLADDPDFGTEPIFPAEHKLALLLPLGLPVAMTLVQVLVKELKASGFKLKRR
jgi:hypothetical protein